MHTNKKLLILTMFATALLGCGNENSDKSNQSQVAATVNDKEITVHQVNVLLKGMPNVNAGNLQQAANGILDRLINEEILVQQAHSLNLHRDPDILSAIEAAKQKIIVEAYIGKVISTNPDISNNQIESYYNENPYYFSDRKLFSFNQIAIKVEENKRDEVINIVEKHNSLDSLIATLEDQDFDVLVKKESKHSEQLPNILLGPLYQLSEGDFGYLRIDEGLLVINPISVIDNEISFEMARNDIVNILKRQKIQQDIESIVKSFRSNAAIEYVGDFSPVDNSENQ